MGHLELSWINDETKIIYAVLLIKKESV
jgi:hypothetical protein